MASVRIGDRAFYRGGDGIEAFQGDVISMYVDDDGSDVITLLDQDDDYYDV